MKLKLSWKMMEMQSRSTQDSMTQTDSCGFGLIGKFVIDVEFLRENKNDLVTK